jgi:hypothetical protein
METKDIIVDPYANLSINLLLDLFPKPPTHVPKVAKVTQTAPLQKLGALYGSTPTLLPKDNNGNNGSPQVPERTPNKKTILGKAYNNLRTASQSTNDLLRGGAVNKSTGSVSSSLSYSSVDIKDAEALIYVLPKHLPPRDYVDLFRRGCKSSLNAADQESLFKFLLSLTPSKIFQMQQAIHGMLVERNCFRQMISLLIVD